MKFMSFFITKTNTLLSFLSDGQVENPLRKRLAHPLSRAVKPSLRTFLGAAIYIALNASFTSFCHAEETLSPWALQLGVGVGSHETRKIDLAAVWDPKLNWLDNGVWHFSVVGEAHLAQWRVLHTKNVTEVGFTPVFLYSKNTGSIAPYIEAGLGVRVLSRARMADNYTLSSAFQFTEILGIGAIFGPAMRYKLGVRVQHISNASIKRPNPGINFAQTFIQYNF